MMKEVALDIDNPAASTSKSTPSQANGHGHGAGLAAAANGATAATAATVAVADTEIEIEIPSNTTATPASASLRLRGSEHLHGASSNNGDETPPTRTASEEHPDPEDCVAEANPLTASGSPSKPDQPSAAAAGLSPDDDVLDELGMSTPKAKASTIVHHHPMYQQYCSCCPEFVATKPRLFITTCCVLSLAAGVLLSICFFYPEGIFGVQPKLAHGNGNGPNPHLIHHPHQNRYVIHSPTAKRTFSSGSSNSHVSNHRETAADHDHYDDESLSSFSGNMYSNLGLILNSGGRQSSQSQSQLAASSKDVITFSELTQTHNYSNVIQSRLLHFDLKGAPPTVSYMKEIMKLGKQAGITGILMEWEDTFPWKGRLINTTLGEDAGYTEEQVQEILDYAEQDLQLEVIPLIQTFGHVEYILKSSEFFHLREDPSDPQSFCPSLPDTIDLIREMINQIVAVHKNAKFLHIGCDEVFNIGLCPLCTASRAGQDRRNSASYDTVETLFLRHVKNVGEIVKVHGMIPIIWDDMLRSITYEKLTEYNLSYFEPMVWVYAEDIDKFVTGEHWAKYNRIFATVWVAGSFKGAFGETLQLPPIQRHAESTQNWIHVVSRESSNWDYGIGGIVLTGWSRYDHFGVLCELLPAAIPSLVYTSLILSIPSTMDSSIIKNRVFIPSNLNITHISVDEMEPEGTSTSILASRRRKKRSPVPAPLPEPDPVPGKKWVPHPQSLRINSMPISTFSGSSVQDGPRNTIWKSSQQTTSMIEKYLHINSEFIRLLHCSSFDKPIAEFELPLLVRDEESAAASGSAAASSGSVGFISRCNFAGIQFYRSLLRLRALQDEIWALDASLTRDRGWVGPYNQRHNFSSPYRVGELIFKETPRLRRNLGQLAKVLANSLKRLYTGATILEWVELNVWSAWEVLDKWDTVGDELKAAKTWRRRPLQSPHRMVRDLGLGPLQLYGGTDSIGRDEL